MRDLKFRAWDTSTKSYYKPVNEYEHQEWLELGLDGATILHENYTGDDGELSSPRSHFILQEYTGLKDKNGKEIYEGDILSLFDPRQQVEHRSKASVVTFENGAFLVDTQMGALSDRTTLKTLYEYLQWREYSDCEVIGNIYEKPELLKGAA